MKWIWLIILMMFLPAASAVSYPQLGGYVTDNANTAEYYTLQLPIKVRNKKPV